MFWILGVKVYYFGIKFWSLFQTGRAAYIFKAVSYSKEPIHTMGEFTTIPDCLIDNTVVSKTAERPVFL